MVGLLASEVVDLVNTMGIQKHQRSRGLTLGLSVSSVRNKDISIPLFSGACELVFQSSWFEL